MFRKIRNSLKETKLKIQEKQDQQAEKKMSQLDTKRFLSSLKLLKESIYPYVSLEDKFDNFREFRSFNEISFDTPESKYSTKELVEITGLTTLRHRSLFSCDRWEASYSEYEAIYKTESAKDARVMQSILNEIYAKVNSCKSEYTDFVFKYTETLANVNEIIKEYGMNFILGEDEILEKIKNLLSSFVEDYRVYSNVVKEFKKEQVIRKLSIEQDYVNKMISDTSLMLEYQDK